MAKSKSTKIKVESLFGNVQTVETLTKQNLTLQEELVATSVLNSGTKAELKKLEKEFCTYKKSTGDAI